MPDDPRAMSVSGARRGVSFACVASVLGALTAGGMVLLAPGARSGAGAVALLSGALLIAAASAAGRPGRPRERVMVSVTDRVYDGAILAPVIWSALGDDAPLAATALVAFACGTLAAYARARACGLGYDLNLFAAASVTRVAILGLALTFGWGAPAYLLLAGWYFGSAAVRVSQVRKEELA